ncbi:glycosyltransferase [Synechococcus sp. AH-601-B19]|nr:glycosyltransferase [Synechococcus sp. AH-601-B19]
MAKSFKKLGVENCFIDNLDSWYSTPPNDYDVVIVLRGLSEYRPYASHVNILWIISHLERVLLDEMKKYDQIYCASKKYSNQLNSQHSLGVMTLLQATDPDLFFRKSFSKSSHTLLFVGISRKIYRKSVKYLVDNGFDDVKVIGREWEDFIDSSYISQQNIPNSELSLEYQSARFVFNDHWDSMMDFGFISNRIFDVVACGGKLITDYVEGIDEIVPNNAVFAYRQLSEISEYLSSPERWPSNEDIKEASSVVSTQHTFLARAETLLTFIRTSARFC